VDYTDPYAERPRYPRTPVSALTVAITGNTRGIGQALATALERRGDMIIGLSRSNGYDITMPEDIVRKSRDADVLICNAHAGFAQAELVLVMARAWAEQPRRLIVAMGSLSADGINPSQGKYALHKKALDAACEQLQADRSVKCRITLVRFGYTDTPRVAAKSVRKMRIAEVVGHVLYAIDQPRGHYLKRLDFRAHHEETL
jgi:NAD(P)-dependent dehydrogenase (short-subunit alcohol dehydrogenase family)